MKADRGKAISRSKTQFLMVLKNTKQNLPFLGSLWGIELRFSLSHHVELKFFLTISSCSNKARNNFPFRRYQKRLIMVIELSGVQFGLKSYAWFEITSMISDQNCTTRGSITTLLHPFWNRPNTGLGQFKYFIDAVLSRSEIKFIQFLGGKSKSLETKVAKFATWYTLCRSFSCNLIGYFKQALKSDWWLCF